MDKTQEEKIRLFINDKVMSAAVYDMLLKSFIKPSDRADVNVLAASRIAIDLLQESWKELKKFEQYRDDTKSNVPTYV